MGEGIVGFAVLDSGEFAHVDRGVQLLTIDLGSISIKFRRSKPFRPKERMSMLSHFIAAVAVLGLGILAMAIGQILRKKSISHCGGSSMTFRGEKIRCPGCKGEQGSDCEKLEKVRANPDEN